MKNRLSQYHNEDHILNNMLYAVEMMEDNHIDIANLEFLNHPHYVCAESTFRTS